MKKAEVPQDVARAFMGQGKALYALDDSGAYTMVRSAGWEAEEIVLNQAIEECERQARDAHARARRGETSPLEYHMFQRRMDVVVLAQSVGLFKWQVKRHLRPHTFASLSPRLRGRYAEALGLSVDALNSLPDVP